MMNSQSVPNTFSLTTKQDNSLLRSIVEMLVDGVLVISTDGEWIYGNHNAHRICQELKGHHPVPGKVPDRIWQVCRLFLERVVADPHYPALIESEIGVTQSTRYRVRVRAFPLEEAKSPYLLVTLEDCCQAAHNRAIAEVQQYGLTARQSEVWQLHRQGYTYREIADSLFVTLNTVKRHMKDIYAKQKLVAS